MLRALVVALLLANLGFWAWREGWLAPLHGFIGARPEGDREPQRMQRALRPEAIELLTSGDASPRVAAAAVQAGDPGRAPGTACLEGGPYAAAELAAVQATLQAAMPEGGWVVREPVGAWWVAIGPFPDRETQQKKREELSRRELAPEPASPGPGRAPLLVLARFDSRVAAEQELALLVERGVRNVRVVDTSGAAPRRVRMAEASVAQQATLQALAAEPLRGKPFAPCPP
jgi:hypothetical protein